MANGRFWVRYGRVLQRYDAHIGGGASLPYIGRYYCGVNFHKRYFTAQRQFAKPPKLDPLLAGNWGFFNNRGYGGLSVREGANTP